MSISADPSIPAPQGGTPARSAFVTILGITSLAVAGLLLMTEVFSLWTTMSLVNSPEMIMLQKEMGRIGGGRPPVTVDFTPILFGNMLNIVVDAGFGIAAVGLVRRRRWGYRSYIVLLFVNLGVMIVTSALSESNVRLLANQTTGLTEVSGAGPLGALSIILNGIALIVGLILAGVLTWKLTRPAIRAEFGAS